MPETIPTLSINAIEAIWIGLTLLTLGLTGVVLREAQRDREVVTRLNGRARELAAGGNVRRARLDLLIQVLLLFVALPGLFSDREATVNPIVVALMAVPVVLFVSTALDLIERRAVLAAIAKETA